MKKQLFLLIFASMILCLPAVSQNDSRELYEHKVQSYTRMKSAGGALMGVGLLAGVVGAVVLATTPDYIYDDYGFATNDDEVTMHVSGGIICLSVGIDMLIGGIVLNSIGSKKVKLYKAKLDNLSMKILYTPKQQGFMLTYRF